MTRIEDDRDAEIRTVETTLRDRRGARVPYQLADGEIRLRPSDRALIQRPIVYREMGGCNFVIAMTGDRRYRAQFLYRGCEQFGAGLDACDDLTECAVSPLQSQADHDRSQAQQRRPER